MQSKVQKRETYKQCAKETDDDVRLNFAGRTVCNHDPYSTCTSAGVCKASGSAPVTTTPPPPVTTTPPPSVNCDCEVSMYPHHRKKLEMTVQSGAMLTHGVILWITNVGLMAKIIGKTA